MPIFVNDNHVESLIFNGGECHVCVYAPNVYYITEVYAELDNSDDIMTLLLTVDAVRRIYPTASIRLTIPYFPYARQDRVCNPGEALSIKVMADLINSLRCDSVTIFDPHSDVTPALINNCVVKSIVDIIAYSPVINEKIVHEELILVSPDAGAEKKVRQLAKLMQKRVICATKERDTKTGEIISTHVCQDVENENLIIIDDICDGGRTFLELAKYLKKFGANDIYLYVTHGIFSKGMEQFKKLFKHIYCYHVLNDLYTSDEFLTVLKEMT